MATNLTNGKITLNSVGLIGNEGNIYKGSVSDGNEVITKKDILSSFPPPHNNLYRGANLIAEFGSKQAIYSALASGDLSNFFIGDYIDCTITTEYTANEDVRMLVAGINMYRGLWYSSTDGEDPLKNWLVLVPEDTLAKMHQINTSITVAGGYRGSYMCSTILPKYATAFNTFFDSHVVPVSHMVSSSVNGNLATNVQGTLSPCILMSEVQVFGCGVLSGKYDIGDANTQLPLFRLRPDKIGVSRSYWLSGIVSSVTFCRVTGRADTNCPGYSTFANSDSNWYIRPIILLSGIEWNFTTRLPAK